MPVPKPQLPEYHITALKGSVSPRELYSQSVETAARDDGAKRPTRTTSSVRIHPVGSLCTGGVRFWPRMAKEAKGARAQVLVS